MFLQQVDSGTAVSYCVVSDEYWPSLHIESTLSHHPRAACLQDKYTSTFDSIKKPKKLEVAAQLGQVFLDLDFDDGTTREFSVSPTQVWSGHHVALFACALDQRVLICCTCRRL